MPQLTEAHLEPFEITAARDTGEPDSAVVIEHDVKGFLAMIGVFEGGETLTAKFGQHM